MKTNKLMCMYMALVHVAAFFGCAVLWRQPDFPHKLAELIVWYLVTGLGITAGCHRLWSHRSFQAKPPTRFVLMLLASMCSQGSIYHCHIGWLLLHKPSEVKSAGQQIDCSDLLDDWIVRLNHRLDPGWNIFCCFIVPGIYGAWRLESFLDGLLLFGALRYVIVLHATWCVNSVAHHFGHRPYRPKEKPAESFVTSVLCNGEGWHNWHHAYPWDYAAAQDGILLQWNPTKLLLDGLWLIGQTHSFKRKVIHGR